MSHSIRIFQHIRALLGTLRELLCCLPQVLTPADIDYRNVFRVMIMQFISWTPGDSMCVARPDARRIIPFDTYNLFYRDELENSVLDPSRPERETRA